MFKNAKSFLLFSLLGCSATVWAAGSMKQGLWEMTIKSGGTQAGAHPDRQMSAQQMEKMRQMGVNVPEYKDGAMITKMCVSKEMSEREHSPLDAQQKNSDCKSSNVKHNGNHFSVDIVCDGPNLKGEGKAQGTFSGTDSYQSTYDFKGGMRGKPVNHHQESSAKWLSADCGNVKPISDFLPKGKK